MIIDISKWDFLRREPRMTKVQAEEILLQLKFIRHDQTKTKEAMNNMPTKADFDAAVNSVNGKIDKLSTDIDTKLSNPVDQTQVDAVTTLGDRVDALDAKVTAPVPAA